MVRCKDGGSAPLNCTVSINLTKRMPPTPDGFVVIVVIPPLLGEKRAVVALTRGLQTRGPACDLIHFVLDCVVFTDAFLRLLNIMPRMPKSASLSPRPRWLNSHHSDASNTSNVRSTPFFCFVVFFFPHSPWSKS